MENKTCANCKFWSYFTTETNDKKEKVRHGVCTNLWYIAYNIYDENHTCKYHEEGQCEISADDNSKQES
jgi:hypothetical protein